MSIEAREARQPWILLAPALTAICLLLIVPLMFIVVYSFWLKSAQGADTPGFFLDNWQEVLTDRFYRDILLNTLKISAITTLACAVLGYPAAYFIARSKGNKLILLVLLMLPFWISYIIRTMSWINILGVSGALNSALIWVGIINEPIQMLYNETTVILGLVHFLLPFMVLNIFVSLAGIDTNLEDAASSLGATRWQGFLQVALPLSLPGVFAGSLLVFIPAAGDYLNARYLGNPNTTMIGTVVQNKFLVQSDYPVAAALSLVLMAIITVLVLIYSKFLGTEGLAV